MASRLYRTTRPLYLAIEHGLRRVRLRELGSPTLLILMVWTVTGLLLLNARPSHTRLARVLLARCHDAMGRLLRDMPWSTRALSRLLITSARLPGWGGYWSWMGWVLVLDEVIIEKAMPSACRGRRASPRSPRNAWCWCGARAMGSGVSRLAFACGGPTGRVGRSATPRSWSCHWSRCRPPSWRISRCKYIVGDTHDTAGWFTKRLTCSGLTWQAGWTRRCTRCGGVRSRQCVSWQRP